MKDPAYCRECSNWSPIRNGRPSMIGECAHAREPSYSWVAGIGWTGETSWFGARKCKRWQLSVGAQATEQNEAVALVLLEMPLANRRAWLARMDKEDPSATETVKGRMIALHAEKKANV